MLILGVIGFIFGVLWAVDYGTGRYGVCNFKLRKLDITVFNKFYAVGEIDGKGQRIAISYPQYLCISIDLNTTLEDFVTKKVDVYKGGVTGYVYHTTFLCG